MPKSAPSSPKSPPRRPRLRPKRGPRRPALYESFEELNLEPGERPSYTVKKPDIKITDEYIEQLAKSMRRRQLTKNKSGLKLISKKEKEWHSDDSDWEVVEPEKGEDFKKAPDVQVKNL